MARRGRELRTHQDEHAVAVALERLRVEVVVVGDRDEGEAGRPRRRDHLLGRAAAVGERRVDVDDAGDPRVAVRRAASPTSAQRPPQGDAAAGRAPPAASAAGEERRAARASLTVAAAPAHRLKQALSSPALFVCSHVNSGSLRPKWP